MINPYTIIGALVLLIVVALGGTATGWKLSDASWQKKELATKERAALELALAHQRNDRLQKANEAKARKASADHEKAISELNQKYDEARAAIRAAGGLRVSRAICSPTTTAEGASASGPDEATTTTVALPQEIERRLLDLTQEAEALAIRLGKLQKWARDNGHYGDES